VGCRCAVLDIPGLNRRRVNGLTRVRTGVPKDRTGQVEALRNLRVARRSAVDQRADCQRRITSLIVIAAEPLRAQLRDLPLTRLIRTCAGLRPDPARIGEPEQATMLALPSLARRHAALTAEIDDLDTLIGPPVAELDHDLLETVALGRREVERKGSGSRWAWVDFSAGRRRMLGAEGLEVPCKKSGSPPGEVPHYPSQG
jgi:hypothetical protein